MTLRTTDGSERIRRLLAAVLAIVAAACGEPGRNGGGASDERAPTGRSEVSQPPEARYLTTVAFTALDSGPALLLRLEQEAGPGRLERSYRGWLGAGGRWSSVLSLQDTIPVPGAGWRVLPGGPLRVRVGRGGEVSGLRLAAREGPVALELGPAVATWTVADSGRAGLRRSLLRIGPDSFSGLALLRRTASARSASGPPLDGRGFLFLALSDSEGLVAPLPTGDRTGGRAHGRLDGRTGPWDSVAVVLPTGSEAGAVRLPDGTFAVDLQVLDDGVAPAAELRGRILGGSARTVRGLLVRPRER